MNLTTLPSTILYNTIKDLFLIFIIYLKCFIKNIEKNCGDIKLMPLGMNRNCTHCKYIILTLIIFRSRYTTIYVLWKN